jgi:hypothetical protein
MTGFTLEEVLIHEFGHWVVAQECDIQPDGIVIRGILWDASQSTVVQYGAMPFSTTFRYTIGETATYAAGLVAEVLSFGTFDLNNVRETLERDSSYSHDFKMMIETAGRSEKKLLDAIKGAHDLLLPRIGRIRREAHREAVSAAALRSAELELRWSPERASRLSDRPDGWFG